MDDDDDAFYELTTDDFREMQRIANANRRKEEGGLKTKKLREAEERKRALSFGSIPVRIQFPDGVIVQAAFSALETLNSLQELVAKFVIKELGKKAKTGYGFYLYTTPPRQPLKELDITFYQADLVPAAHVYFHAKEDRVSADTTTFYKPELAVMTKTDLTCTELPGQGVILEEPVEAGVEAAAVPGPSAPDASNAQQADNLGGCPTPMDEDKKPEAAKYTASGAKTRVKSQATRGHLVSGEKRTRMQSARTHFKLSKNSILILPHRSLTLRDRHSISRTPMASTVAMNKAKLAEKVSKAGARVPAKSKAASAAAEPLMRHFSEDEVSLFRSSLLHFYDHEHRTLPWRSTPHSQRSGPPHPPGAEPAPASLSDQDFAYRGHRHSVLQQVIAYFTHVSQLQVATVIAYFNKWVARWPTVADLAAASVDDVNEMWAGLGYYRRARYLLDGAKFVMEKLGGLFPPTASELLQVPGVGPYTAAAVSSISFNHAAAAVDGNVIRVVSRLRALPGDPTKLSALHAAMASELLHPGRPGCHNQAMRSSGPTDDEGARATE
eukprot:gene5522-4155_t